jgi:hypothetical protein
MTRTQSISVIQETLASLDDAEVATVAEIVQTMAAPFKFRDLTPDELAGIERSRADFRAGRTVSRQDYNDEMDAFMQRLKAKYPEG